MSTRHEPKSQAGSTSTQPQGMFIEQAEYIEDDSFEQWTIEHPEETIILQKLAQPGAKLLTGPRGCGKTTLMRKSFRVLCDGGSECALPVYVNFKSSLRLEPFYKNRANAVVLFGTWMLYKLYQGLHETISQLKLQAELSISHDVANRVTSQLELGQDALSDAERAVNVARFEEDVRRVLAASSRRRSVLLLDDAAHAFSPEQQRDFFEFFRQLKSREISPKAAIYPGVTVYSPTFHVGHDAEEIDVWIKPDTKEYLPFMARLLERRLPVEVFSRLQANSALLELLSFSAFGVPRALLNMIRLLYREGDDEDANRVVLSASRLTALRAIRHSHESTMSVFASLEGKLPMYANFIRVGKRAFAHMIDAVKAFNHGKLAARQSVTVAIRQPLSPELKKLLAFFQYAGLLLPKGEISKGEKGVFDLYAIHYAALVDRNAFFGKKSISIADYAEAFKKRNASEFTRTTSRALVGTEDAASVLSLSLPPCQVCSTPRVNESAKFCLNCGSQLKSVSVFEKVVEQDIDTLPLTAHRVASIKQNSKIRTIKDILMDHEHRELRSVPRIGPVWAKRIYAYAEEQIA